MMSDAVREHWDAQASLYGVDERATMPDVYLRQLEIEAIKKYLRPTDRILDVGCGNGCGTVRLAEAARRQVIGVDFSARMIEKAKERLASCKEEDVRQRVLFRVGDVRHLSPDLGVFDKVTTARCLINLASAEAQVEALRSIHSCLRTGGRAVLSEDSLEGLVRINELRRMVGLSELAVRWHNQYLDVPRLMSEVTTLFRLVTVDEFASTYYMVSRVINARLAADRGEEPRYECDMNRVAALLPAAGDYGLLKIIVLERV
jgi:SAM-dependent methyltransferase